MELGFASTWPRSTSSRVNAAKQAPDGVAGLSRVQQLVEHLHTSHHRLARLAEPYNLDFVAGFDESSLDAPRHYGAAPFDAEDVLYGHEERQVLRPIGHRHVVVHCLHELDDALDILIVGITPGFPEP